MPIGVPLVYEAPVVAAPVNAILPAPPAAGSTSAPRTPSVAIPKLRVPVAVKPVFEVGRAIAATVAGFGVAPTAKS